MLVSEVLLYCSDRSYLPFVSVLRTPASSCQICFLEGLIVSNKDIILQDDVRMRVWCRWLTTALTLVWLFISLTKRPVPLRRIMWILVGDRWSWSASEDVCGMEKKNPCSGYSVHFSGTWVLKTLNSLEAMTFLPYSQQWIPVSSANRQ